MSKTTKAVAEASYMAGMDLAMSADDAVLEWSYDGTPVMTWRAGVWKSALRPREGQGDQWVAYRQACFETQRAIDAGRIKAMEPRRQGRFSAGGQRTTD
jgi:hypothetical protein